MISLDAFSVAGWVGMVLIILAYFLLSIKKLRPHSITYNLLNLFGGIGLAINTFVTKSWPAFALNILWFIIAFFSIFQIRSRKPAVYKEIK